MLHLVAFPPNNTQRLRQALQRIDAGDDVVLLELAQEFATSLEHFSVLSESIAVNAPSTTVNFFLLGDENIASQLPVARIDYSQLIALTEKHAASLSWYP